MEKRAPFDPQSEVKKIRELSADEHALSREDRLAIRKERLHAFKELNTLQQEGIALCIRTLQRAITERPDVPIKELWNIVDDFSQKIRLSKRQKKLFIDTIALFEDSRSRVFALYRTYKEKPQELFARCFEFEPRGQIDLAHTPFMLYFKTHKIEDYIDAFLYQRTDVPPDPEESTDTPKHARQSAGFIKSGTGLKSPFTGIVAVEKGSTFNKNELLAHRESRDLAPFPAAIFIHLFEIKKIHITHENDNQILITCSDTPPKQPDMIGKRVVITADNTVLFDCTLVRKDDKKSIYSTPIDSETSALLMDDHAFWNHAYWRNTTATTKRERERLRHEPIIRIPNHEDARVSIQTTQQGDFFITHKYDKPITINLTRQEWVSGIPRSDPGRSFIQAHEEQHIINELFKPVEAESEPLTAIVGRVLRDFEGMKTTPSALRREIFLRYCRVQRRLMGVDSQIRDEIIAYYKQGESPKNIYDTLSKSDLYSVTGRLFGKKIPLLPETLSDAIAQAIRKDHSKDADALRKLFHSPASLRGMQKVIRRVFGKEYQHDLKAWIQSIVQLRYKGYNREEILSHLYSAPVNAWVKIAQRLPDRTRHARVSD